MPSPLVALEAQAACLDQRLRVGCFRPPSVPDGVSRLRITTSAGVPEVDWEHTCELLAKIVAAYR